MTTVIRLILSMIFILTLFSKSVLAVENSNILIKHVTSYTIKSMIGVIPLKIYFDRQQNELYVGSQSKEIAVINADGMIVHRIPLADSLILFCVNRNGNIYISDNKGGISILNYRGEYIKNLDLSTVPDSTLLAIQSLHMDENGHLYIGDGRLSRIIVLDSSGKFLYQFGKKGSGDGEFLNAKAITTDAERLYLLDPPLFRVSVYDKKDGRFLFMFGQISSLLGGFSMPSSIDTDGKRLFVVDTNRAIVIVFNREGKPIIEFGGVGRNPDSLSWPSDVKVDGNGNIYVCDTGNGRIQIYELKNVQQIDEVKSPKTIEPIEKQVEIKVAESLKAEPIIERVIEPPPVEQQIESIKIENQEEEVLVEVFKNLEFESGKAVIKQSSFKFLNKLYELLAKKPAYKLHIAGHTDNIGSEADNLRLGHERTDMVKAYLANKGITPSRIITVSFGESKPIADNSTEEGKKINRRVEFLIVK